MTGVWRVPVVRVDHDVELDRDASHAGLAQASSPLPAVADEALYRAERSGRDRMAAAEPVS